MSDHLFTKSQFVSSVSLLNGYQRKQSVTNIINNLCGINTEVTPHPQLLRVASRVDETQIFMILRFSDTC